MSAPSPKDQSLLINKLTLMVLAGIFVCLVVLIVRQRNFMADRDHRSQARAALDQSPALEESAANDGASLKDLRAIRPFKPPSAPPMRSFPAVATVPSQEDSPPFELVRENPPPVVVPPPVVLVSSTAGLQGGEIAGTVWLRGTPPPE